MKQNKAYKILEFDKILDKLSDYTLSEATKNKIKELKPYKTVEEAKTAQRETTEAVITMLKIGAPPVSLGVASPAAAVKRSEMEGTLSMKELLEISKLLYSARRMKSYLDETHDECTILSDIKDRIITAKSVEDEINSCILSETEMADDASPEQ